MEHLCRRREQIEAREKRVLGEMPIATCLDRLEHGGTTACLPAEGLSASRVRWSLERQASATAIDAPVEFRRRRTAKSVGVLMRTHRKLQKRGSSAKTRIMSSSAPI